MRINITSGECLNELLKQKHEEETFIPFNEAMIKGSYHHKLFSKEFIKERAIVHNVSEEEYQEKLTGFLHLLENINDYDQIILWFGDEDFCQINRQIVIHALREYGYENEIILHIVNEETTQILKTINI